MRLIPIISSITAQGSKEKFGLMVAKQAAFLNKICTGTSWEFSQNILLEYVPKDSETSLREAIMTIPSSKFPGKPVFHTVDPAWGTDNEVTFNFIPENEAEARMFIAGLVPYIRDTLGEKHLRPFSVDAIDHHSDSVYNKATNQISSTTDIWINSSLALDDEFNYTDNPTEPTIFQTEHLPTRHSTIQEAPSIYRDSDSSSTFRSRLSTTPAQATPRSEGAPSASDSNDSQGTQVTVSQVHQVSIASLNMSVAQ
jgi:hypothetical protein